MADETQSALRCTWCGEGIFDDRTGGLHPECGVRVVIGSVKCQQGLCPDCGDDPALSLREAARQAADFWGSTCTCDQHPRYCPLHPEGQAVAAEV